MVTREKLWWAAYDLFWLTTRMLLVSSAFVIPFFGTMVVQANWMGSYSHIAARPIVVSLPLTASGSYPPCPALDSCEMFCRVNDAGDAWVCTEEDGTAVTVTENGTIEFENCFVGKKCLSNLNITNYPSILHANVPGDIDLTSPATVIIISHVRDSTHADARVFGWGVRQTAGLTIRIGSNGTNTFCGWSEAGLVVDVAVPMSAANRWTMISCDQTSDTDREITVNGVSTSSAQDVTTVQPVSEDMVWGHNLVANRQGDAAVHSMYFFSAVKDSAFKTTFQRIIFGTAGSHATTFDRNSTAWCEQADGQYLAVGQDMPCVGRYGYQGWGAVTNYAKDSLDSSQWTTPTGAGTANADASSGPFSVYNNGPEVDEIEDDDGGVAEYFVIVNDAALDAGTYTVSYWAKEGTRSSFGIQIGCTGGSGTLSPVQNLTSTLTRYEHTTTCTGNTATHWRIYPATFTAGQTGTIHITGLQFEVAAVAGRPCLAGSSTTTCAADTMLVDNVGLPTGQGTIQFEYTPDLVDPGQGSAAVLYDSGPNGEGQVGHTMNVRDGKNLRLTTRNSSGFTDTDTPIITWVPGTSELIQGAWGSGVGQVYQDGALLKTTTGGNMPDGHTGSSFGLCNRDNLDRQCNGWIKNLEIRQ